MLSDDKSILVLMVQNSRTVFCYFNTSSMTIKEFQDRYGENSWKNSKPIIKLYQVENGNAKEIKSMFIDTFANNWYISLDKDDIDVFVKLGRLLPDDTFAAVAVSNTVTTPRDHQSGDSSVYFVDVSQNFKEPDVKLPIYKDDNENESIHKEPKPYPFMEIKKN